MQELCEARMEIDYLNHKNDEMEINIEALAGLLVIYENREMRDESLEAELNVTRKKVSMGCQSGFLLNR